MGENQFIRVGNDANSGYRNYRPNRTLIKFDFIPGITAFGITGASQIVNAWIDLNIYSSEGQGQQGFYVDIFRLKEEWGEGTKSYAHASTGEVTWNAAKHNLVEWFSPGAGNTTYDRELVMDGSTFINRWGQVPDVWLTEEYDPSGKSCGSFNVTTSVKYMLENDENFGWLLQAHEENMDKYFRIYSSESNYTSLRPKLTVVANVPIGTGRQLSKNVSTNEEITIDNTPSDYKLSQNYPNPFNPDTYIKYQIPENANVLIKIYNALGQEIKTLINEEKTAGYYTVHWDGKDSNGLKVGSGIYFYRMTVGQFSKTQKMLLLE
ncbi:T9SS type A sorting domain-containing protein [candidate division KSB1 bacterium]|nr:T9SS type A sorting domain-containing protein [candidate division KSB1 bacterium]MBL7093777.1 T9SS type A sorting domain-containing protein [candidate division KSB1 bacterium]